MTARDDLTEIAADAYHDWQFGDDGTTGTRTESDTVAAAVLDALAAHPNLYVAYAIETGALKPTVWHYEPDDTPHPHRICNDRCRTVYRTAERD